MLGTFLHLLAQTPVEGVQKKTAAEEGKDVILSMLVVGLVIVGFIVIADLLEWRSRVRHSRRRS